MPTIVFMSTISPRSMRSNTRSIVNVRGSICSSGSTFATRCRLHKVRAAIKHHLLGRRIPASGRTSPTPRSSVGLRPISSSHSRAAARRGLSGLERPGRQLPDPSSDDVPILPDQHDLRGDGWGTRTTDPRCRTISIVSGAPVRHSTSSRSTRKTRPVVPQSLRVRRGQACQVIRSTRPVPVSSNSCRKIRQAAAPRTSSLRPSAGARRSGDAACRNGRVERAPARDRRAGTWRRTPP